MLPQKLNNAFAFDTEIFRPRGDPHPYLARPGTYLARRVWEETGEWAPPVGGVAHSHRRICHGTTNN
jgi:hypothetical protein